MQQFGRLWRVLHFRANREKGSSASEASARPAHSKQPRQRHLKWEKRSIRLFVWLIGLAMLSSLPHAHSVLPASGVGTATTAASTEGAASSSTGLVSPQIQTQASLTGIDPQQHAQPNADPCDLTNFQMGDCLVEALTTVLFGGFEKYVNQQIQTAISLTFLIGTPANLTYQHPVVTALYGYVQIGLGGMLALVIVIAGYRYLWGDYSTFREFAGSFTICSVLANFSLGLLAQFIDLENSLSAALPTAILNLPFFASYGYTNLFQFFMNLPSLSGFLYLFAAIEMVMILFLAVQMLLRIALLDLLLIVAPLGIMCFALPHTQRWGRLWAEAFGAALIVQFLQLLTLALGAALIASVSLGGPLVTIGSGIGALYLTFKIPGMLLSGATRALGSAQEGGSRAAQRAATAIAAVI